MKMNSYKEMFMNVLKTKHNKIVCIGKNYNDHVLEMKEIEQKMGVNKNNQNQVKVNKKPIIFTKPFDSIIEQTENISLSKIIPDIDLYLNDKNEISSLSNESMLKIKDQKINYEFELGIEIGEKLKNYVSKNDNNFSFINSYFVGLDLTNRTLQQIGKDDNTGWFYGKEFNQSTPISSKIARVELEKLYPDFNPQNIDLIFKVNGETRQIGNTKDMIHSIKNIVEYVTSIMTLEEGDLILTGTPKGIGEINVNDSLEGKAYYKNSEILSLKYKVVH